MYKKVETQKTCYRCNGTGKLNKKKCKSCNGTGNFKDYHYVLTYKGMAFSVDTIK